MVLLQIPPFISAFPEFEHGRAAAAAANELILSAMRQLRVPNRMKDTAAPVVAPLFSMELINGIISGVERDRMARFYNRLVTSRFPNDAARRLIGHIKFAPLQISARSPFRFEERRKLIYRPDLAYSIQLHDWILVLNALAAHLIRDPTHLAHLMWSGISDIAET